jgi:cytochrome b pre-mRNA-processing protein 3
MAFKLLERLVRREPARPPMDELYRAVVAIAREPRWYTAGAVPDTLDGRFDMVALVLSLTMIRLEREEAPHALVGLTERFVEDMDGSLREIGVGDLVVGKHVGRMVGALEGRLGAYRSAIDGAAPLNEALVRNLYRGEPPSDAAIAWVEAQVPALMARLDATPLDRLLTGDIAS